MTYQSVHTGAEVDAAVAVLNDVQEIRTEVEGYKNTVVSLAGQVQTDAGNASSDAATALQAASDALDSKNAAYASEQAASGHAANADSARAQAVVARNGAEDALGEALNAESRMIELLSDSGPTVDELRAAIRRINYGDGPYPSLDLNFVGATMLDPRVTFTRSSDATYFDAMGALQTAQPNEPRFEYDPVTGKSLGLLVERQATNLLLGSDSPATQTVVVTATAMTLSFIGTGTITLSDAYTGALVGTGDERVTLTFTPSDGLLTLTVSGNVEFAQLETGTVATSYIPTEGSQVTRTQDVALITPDDWLNPIEGTFIVDFIAPVDSGFNTLIGMGSANSEEFRFGYGSSTQGFRITVNAGDGQQVTSSALLQPGNRYKAAATFKPISGGIGWKCAVSGTVIGSVVVTPRMPTGFVENGIAIGRRRPNSNTLHWNGTAASISYYPRALSDAELQALTAL